MEQKIDEVRSVHWENSGVRIEGERGEGGKLSYNMHFPYDRDFLIGSGFQLITRKERLERIDKALGELENGINLISEAILTGKLPIPDVVTASTLNSFLENLFPAQYVTSRWDGYTEAERAEIKNPKIIKILKIKSFKLEVHNLGTLEKFRDDMIESIEAQRSKTQNLLKQLSK